LSILLCYVVILARFEAVVFAPFFTGLILVSLFIYGILWFCSLQHTTITAKNHVRSSVILDQFLDKKADSVFFRGIGHTIDSNNVLAIKVLTGNPTTYSADPLKAVGEFPDSAGADTLLVTAFQARNNARLLFSGSLDMFSNAFFRATAGKQDNVNNELFCDDIAQWVFGDTGVLRFRDITHLKVDGTPPDVILHEKERPDLPESLYPDPELTRNSLVYRIKDEIAYTMVVEEYRRGAWQPYRANDMQMEFVMLDPHVRKTMTCDDRGVFKAVFTAPDNYGIFKFRVLYRRVGYSVLHAETQVSIRPFKHNEYERFIFSAYPYYASAISAMTAFLVFSVSFLFSSDGRKQ
jgi:oligosaccharyltransferase complex subunit beta